MSKRRTIAKAPFDGPEYRKARGPNGRRLCRWCGVEVPKGRQTWCSQGCVDEFLIRKDPNTVRQKLFDRDRGACALCGLDTLKLDQILHKLGSGSKPVRIWSKGRLGCYGPWVGELLKRHWRARRRAILSKLRERGFHDPTTRSLWDADHVKAVVDGGGGCGLDNYRTLCVPCHKKVTAELAARRARERRAKQKARRLMTDCPAPE